MRVSRHGQVRWVALCCGAGSLALAAGLAEANVRASNGPSVLRMRSCDDETEAATVKLWQARNPKDRDFRLESVGPIYCSSLLEPQSPGVHVARVTKAEKRLDGILY
jgi:hypothetical protein